MLLYEDGTAAIIQNSMGMLTHLVNMEMPSGSAAPFVQWKTFWTGTLHKSISEEEVVDVVLVSSEVAEWVGPN